MNVVPSVIRVAIADPVEDAMEIDSQLPIPLYFQLKTLLLEEILSGRYGPEERLPTEHELCHRYRISRTPVTRALSELADEGVILRHRRRGSFVNPHWLSRRPDQSEIRVIVPSEGPWARMVRDAAGGSNQINVVKVPGHSLHHTLTHAVAEGLAPDVALLDNVWAPEFAAAGFIYALEELNERWVREEHEVDFLEPLVRVNRYEGRTFGVSPFADVAGLWYRRDELERLGLDAPGDVGRPPDGRACVRGRRNAVPDRHARRIARGRGNRVFPDRLPGLQRRAGPRPRGCHARFARDGTGAALPPEPRRGGARAARRRGVRVEPDDPPPG